MFLPVSGNTNRISDLLILHPSMIPQSLECDSSYQTVSRLSFTSQNWPLTSVAGATVRRC